MLEKRETVIDGLVNRSGGDDSNDSAHAGELPRGSQRGDDVPSCHAEGTSANGAVLWCVTAARCGQSVGSYPVTNETADSYARAGVNTAAGDRAVELMKSAVSATHDRHVRGGVGGFAGLYDVSFLKNFRAPLLATSTDGVGTKVALAQAVDKHDTIGQDLVGMVVDDIVVVGARPLFMTDYIACGTVIPTRIADIVAGIARACSATGTALVGGETAEHPGLLGPDDYDLAGAAVGAVESDRVRGAEQVLDGDLVIAMASSGLHSNGYSLVRHILAERGIALTDHSVELGGVVGEVLLEPTRLYTRPLLDVLEDPVLGSAVHSISHVTGGGIAANLARVLPRGAWVEIDRASWSPSEIFRVLAALSGASLESTEGTWNLGIGMFAVVADDAVSAIIARLAGFGVPSWVAGRVSTEARPGDGFEQGTKGVDGGAVRLVGAYAA
ncbi:phosphoribosylformylglycinamidine cyclo-ligase [Rathayibacter toxicus]|uniref:Phosphoribosylformylglycinamidine cyclo-ligase n=1 Tax=Rathayibacter toxicus TaxID=145458 RepID=A0A2S5Y4R4_9MICO|nr:phosphoribosylformylglycinamidine cyclo-ligase [Rathayibacter toxicus]PPG46086.1 phosphoribosylformylglycinamidine cyclo-ligase [Rathayibacter toxicus]PPH21021.1 phosphoribosylformylglycinamidine cyclo-ligase [Rathayibacter toxicus]PPH56424.1 phosphoribosylformylglycinamidine cyclo-ligase [Rathayibacter toxicus]PPH58522.1 phosphoribosylformylglycinamidine cyclo-ligase [Rathayibacter toxicus]